MERWDLLYYPQRGSTASRQCPRTPISLLTIWHCSRFGYLIWLASQSIQSLSYSMGATHTIYYDWLLGVIVEGSGPREISSAMTQTEFLFT